MLYLGIDRHRKQLTVGIRNEPADVTLRRENCRDPNTHEVKSFRSEGAVDYPVQGNALGEKRKTPLFIRANGPTIYLKSR